MFDTTKLGHFKVKKKKKELKFKFLLSNFDLQKD